MKREILCKECATKQVPMHSEDVLNRFHRRAVELLVKKPAVHGITVIEGVKTEFHPLRSLVCDHCDQPLNDGSGAVAVTWWNEHRESEPGDWEKEYRYA